MSNKNVDIGLNINQAIACQYNRCNSVWNKTEYANYYITALVYALSFLLISFLSLKDTHTDIVI